MTFDLPAAEDLRVAWSTGGWAGAGSAELRERAEEQVDVLEKGNRWKERIKLRPR